MASEDTQIPFVLGMFSSSGSPDFPALVLDDEAAIAIHALLPLAARLGLALTGSDSLFGLLQNWDHNFTALKAVVTALDDAQLGKGTRGAFTAVEFLDPSAPIAAPRQIFCAVEEDGQTEPHFVLRLPSAITGPKAPLVVPAHISRTIANVEMGAVISKPTRFISAEAALDHVAGFITVTDATALDFAPGPGEDRHMADWIAAKSAPTFMPTGPYFVPTPFAGDPGNLTMSTHFNGEISLESNTSELAFSVAEQISALSRKCQLFPGDIVATGKSRALTRQKFPILGDGDIVECAVGGLGQQTINIITKERT